MGVDLKSPDELNHLSRGGGLARRVAPSTAIPAGSPGAAHPGPPEPTPDPNMLWFGLPGKVASGLCFHQVTEKEGVVLLRQVYILVIYRNLRKNI